MAEDSASHVTAEGLGEDGAETVDEAVDDHAATGVEGSATAGALSNDDAASACGCDADSKGAADYCGGGRRIERRDHR